jgi:hypothetical protein
MTSSVIPYVSGITYVYCTADPLHEWGVREEIGPTMKFALCDRCDHTRSSIFPAAAVTIITSYTIIDKLGFGDYSTV